MIPGWEGRDAEEWARILGVPRLELHAEVGSTNARLRSAAAPFTPAAAPFAPAPASVPPAAAPVRPAAPPFTTVVAHAQREGRGREGRRWHSPAGGGLWISVLLPLPPGGPPGVTPLAVGVATAEAVEAVIGRMGGGQGFAVGLKWPNDLLVVRDAGMRTFGLAERVGKLAGILCEAVPGGIVAGIGVNLRAGSDEGAIEEGSGEEGSGEAGFPPVYLERLAGRAVSPSELAGLLIPALRRWADPPADRLEGALREAWDARDLLRGTRVRVTPGVLAPGRTGPRGRVRGVGEEGSLLVEDEVTGETASVRAGQVRWVEP